MKLTSEMVKAKARELGIDCIAIGSIDRYRDAPPLMNPLNYFPECKSIIMLAMRIPRGTYRGILTGTHWHNYTFYSYNRLNTLFRPRLTYALSCFIEDCGAEAVPHYPAVTERMGDGEPLVPGRMPNVAMSVRIMAAGAGLGEIGYSKVFLTPEFGPRVRIGMIMTDAELEPDPILPTGTLCTHCGRCVRECPGNAIPPVDKLQNTIHIKLGEEDVYWGDVDMGRCTLTHHGLNNRISPFLKKDMPNLEYDVTQSNVTEEEAYRLCYTIAQNHWGGIYDRPDDYLIHYYGYVLGHTGYFAICGARGCICACADTLEKSKRIRNLFVNPLIKRKLWILDVRTKQKLGAINPWREEALDRRDPTLRQNEYRHAAGYRHFPKKEDDRHAD